MVVYIYEFSLQSIKAMRFYSTFPRTFWSPLVFVGTDLDIETTIPDSWDCKDSDIAIKMRVK